MSYNLQREEEVKEYVENLGIEYRFGCYKEKKPEVCHLLADYLEAIKKDFPKAAKVFKSNCVEYNYGKSCLKYGNYALIGKGRDKSDPQEALQYFEKGCDLGEPTACLHAGILLTATGPAITVQRDVPKGYNYLKKSCDKNEAMACHYLAGMYLSGVPRNPKEFNPHNPEKNANLNFLIKADMKQAFQFAMKGCELGNAFACANVSLMYKKGDGVEKNLDESKKYFKIAQNLQKAHETTKEVKFQQGLEGTKYKNRKTCEVRQSALGQRGGLWPDSPRLVGRPVPSSEALKRAEYNISMDGGMCSTLAMQIGIIGGSGFDDPSLFENPVERDVTTPFGKPSDILLEGSIKGVSCVLLARHGRKHQYQPSDVNYRANIWALKQLGCTHVLATTATGSLVEQYKPGDLVVLDDFIDRTWGRKCTFYDRTEGGPKGVCHLPMKPAFCEKARQALLKAARTQGYICHESGTAVTIQGPRFSSRAESLMHQQWGGHIVNMTTVPEVVLAKEAGLSYAAVALVTDYDCWRENEQSVSVSEVLEMFARNIKKAIDVIVMAVELLAADTDYTYLDCHEDLVSSAIMLKQ